MNSLEFAMFLDHTYNIINIVGGGQGDDFYNDIIAAWAAADIIPVFAIGNSGPMCSSANSPADQEGAIAVGSTDSSDSISGSSSAGPTTDGRIKPNLCVRTPFGIFP